MAITQKVTPAAVPVTVWGPVASPWVRTIRYPDLSRLSAYPHSACTDICGQFANA